MSLIHPAGRENIEFDDIGFNRTFWLEVPGGECYAIMGKNVTKRIDVPKDKIPIRNKEEI